MSLLSLLSCSGNTSSDGPDGLISDDDLAPVINLISNCRKLSCIDSISLARLTFVKLLTNAGHDTHILVEGSLDL